MDAIPIRSARRGDVPSLLLLWSAMVEENARLDARLTVHPDAKEHMGRALAAWVDDPHRVVVVAEEHARLIVGFAAGQVVTSGGLQGPHRLGEVTDCYVIPVRRRRGAGRRLAARLLDLLRERGAETSRLQVVAKNPDALAFWRSLGYEPLEEVLERPMPRGAGATA